MKLIALALFFFISLGHADEVRDSPDGKYEVIYTSKILYEDNLTIRMKSGGKVIYRTIASTYEPNRFIELIWSPDSTLLAVISAWLETSVFVKNWGGGFLDSANLAIIGATWCVWGQNNELLH